MNQAEPNLSKGDNQMSLNLSQVCLCNITSHHDMCVEVICILADRIFQYFSPPFTIVIVERNNRLLELFVEILNVFVRMVDICAQNRRDVPCVSGKFVGELQNTSPECSPLFCK